MEVDTDLGKGEHAFLLAVYNKVVLHVVQVAEAHYILIAAVSGVGRVGHEVVMISFVQSQEEGHHDTGAGGVATLSGAPIVFWYSRGSMWNPSMIRDLPSLRHLSMSDFTPCAPPRTPSGTRR